MKTIKNYFSIMVVVLLSTLAFTACSSSDDDNNSGDASHDPALIGAWNTTKTLYAEELGGEFVTDITFIFKADGTYDIVAVAMGMTAPTQTYKWHTNGNKLYMTMLDPETNKVEEGETTYTISGKTLTIKDGTGETMTLTRK